MDCILGVEILNIGENPVKEHEITKFQETNKEATGSDTKVVQHSLK
mgnify:CR=1 FL=1